MKLAIPIWNGRVSPVFDSARQLCVVEVSDDGEVVSRSEAAIPASDFRTRARYVSDLDVAILICGAISMPLETLLTMNGIHVIPQVCGPVEDVLNAFLNGGVTDAAFMMPGCQGRQRNRGRWGRRGRGGGRCARF